MKGGWAQALEGLAAGFDWHRGSAYVGCRWMRSCLHSAWSDWRQLHCPCSTHLRSLQRCLILLFQVQDAAVQLVVLDPLAAVQREEVAVR